MVIEHALHRVARWHGEQGVKHYLQWIRKGDDEAKTAAERHFAIADRLWEIVAYV